MSATERINQIKDFLLEHKKKIIIIVIVLAVLIVLFIAIPSIVKDRVIEKIDLLTTNPEVIPNCEINESQTGNFSCSLWINITDFFVNYRNWRHIFHKGTSIEKDEIIDYDEWVDIEKYIPEQSPGLWLDPLKNNLRLCFTTEIENEAKYDEHPINVSKIVRSKGEINKGIEYIDIINIPVRIYQHILFTIEGRLVTIYLDGSIITHKVLKGDIVNNNGNMYIHKNKTYDGHVKKFLYFPYLLKTEEINTLYNSPPE